MEPPKCEGREYFGNLDYCLVNIKINFIRLPILFRFTAARKAKLSIAKLIGFFDSVLYSVGVESKFSPDVLERSVKTAEAVRQPVILGLNGTGGVDSLKQTEGVMDYKNFRICESL